MCFGRRSKKAGLSNDNARLAGVFPYSHTLLSCTDGEKSILPQSTLHPSPTMTPQPYDDIVNGRYTPPPHSQALVPPADPPPPFEPYPSDSQELPPPPAIGYEFSPVSNAPGDLADAGHSFCFSNPISPPQRFTPYALSQIAAGTIPLVPPPPNFQGTITATDASLPRILTSKNGCPDTCLISALPLYAAGYHHPGNTGVTKTIFFEITLE